MSRTTTNPKRDTHLDARDAHPDVRRLDHAHVVGTIPDREQDRFLVLLDKLDHERLLQRRHST